MLVLLLVAGAIALALPTPPAFAGCAARPVEQMRADADATAIGTIVAVDQPPAWLPLQSSSDPVTYWVEIAQVFDGSVQALIEIESRGYPLDSAAEGRSYLLFLRGESPYFTSDACSSIPMPIVESAAADEVATWQWHAPDPGGAAIPTDGPPWVTIGLGAMVMAMVLLVIRDARRRKRRVTTGRLAT